MQVPEPAQRLPQFELRILADATGDGRGPTRQVEPRVEYLSASISSARSIAPARSSSRDRDAPSSALPPAKVTTGR